MKRLIYFMWGLTLIAALLLVLIIPLTCQKVDDPVVESYESGNDEIAIVYDDDYFQYDVWIGNADKGTLKHYIVKLEDVVLIPDVVNEAYIEITRSGKCKLYFFIKWEVE